MNTSYSYCGASRSPQGEFSINNNNSYDKNVMEIMKYLDNVQVRALKNKNATQEMKMENNHAWELRKGNIFLLKYSYKCRAPITS